MGYTPRKGAKGRGGYVRATPEPEAVDPRAAQAEAATAELQGGGFLSQVGEGIGNAIAGVPRAVLSIGEESGKVARLPTTALANVVFRMNRDDLNNNAILRNITLPAITPSEGDPRTLDQALSKGEEALPVTEGIVRGFGQTAGEFDPRDNFANLRRNYSRDPVGSALNDAVSVATVASAGAAGAGKVAAVSKGAGAERAAAALGKVAEGANAIAAAPFAPYRALAKTPALVGERSLLRSLTAIEEGRTPTLFQTATSKLAPLAKNVQGEINRGRSLEDLATDEVAKRALAINKVLPDPIEQQALTAVAEQGAPALAKLRAADPTGFDAYVAERYKGTLAPEAAHLAADLADGTAAGNVTARISAALDLGHSQAGGRAERNAAYEATRPEAAGYEPNAQAVALADNPAQAANALENAPARLKPVLGENRAAVEHMTGIVNDLRRKGLPDAAKQVEDALNDLPTTLREMEEAGIDAEHFFHTNETKAAKSARMARNAGTPRVFRPGSERLRKGDPVYDRTVKGQAQGEREVAVAAVRRQTADRIAAIPGAVEHLGKGRLEGATTLDEARSLGYVPWNPKSLFDTQGRVKSLSEIEVAAGAEHPTMFMPRPLFEQFRNYFEPVRGQTLGLFTDLPNRAYYIKRLALSPSYVVGQVLGNFLGLGPVSSSNTLGFWKHTYKELQSLRKTGDFSPEVADQPRLFRSGQHQAELARLGEDVQGKTGRVGGAISAVTGKANQIIGGKRSAFHAAAFLDNLSRAAFYMTELEKKGSREGALEATLRGMGEFDKMTPFERDYVRRVVPMYAWHRELSKIALHLPADHPLKTAWLLHLGNSVGQPDSPLPDFYEDTVPVGGNLLGVGQIFPFGEIGSDLKDPTHVAGRFLGPTSKMALSQYFQTNPATGKPYAGGTPSVLQQARGSFLPGSELWDGAQGNSDTARYASGEEVLVPTPMPPEEHQAYLDKWHEEHPGERVVFPKVAIPSGQGAMTAISSFLGFPLFDRAIAEKSAADKVARDAAKGTKTPRAKASSGRTTGGYVRKAAPSHP